LEQSLVDLHPSRLRGFVAVADELHFTRAAQKLNVTQQALSGQIRQLEAELGVRLLERSSRRVKLTRAGQALLPEARSVLAAARRAAAAARTAESRSGQPARVACAPGTGPLIRQLLQAAGATELAPAGLEVLEMMPKEIEQALRAGLVDVAMAFMSEQLAAHDWVSFRPLPALPIVAALPGQHRHASRRQLSLAELAEDAWIGIPRDDDALYHDAWRELCQRYGFSPRVVAVAGSLSSMLDLVAAGLGVCVAPTPDGHRPTGVELVPLAGEFATPNLLWGTASDVHVVARFRDAALLIEQRGWATEPS
jgi:DNA-binding transcriptional LysR family regulator